MKKKLTITLDEEVYDGLHERIGLRKISPFIENLLRPHVVRPALEAQYRAMAADAEAERQAAEWIEGLSADCHDEER